MSNEQSPKATSEEQPAQEPGQQEPGQPELGQQELGQQELGEAELEAVAGGAGDAFDGKYLVTGVTHVAGGLSRASKVEALSIKQK